MKNYFRNALAVCVLVVTFTCSVSAEGIMHTDRTPPPPPSPTATEVAPTVLSGDETYTHGASDIMTEIALDLLQNLLVLF